MGELGVLDISDGEPCSEEFDPQRNYLIDIDLFLFNLHHKENLIFDRFEFFSW